MCIRDRGLASSVGTTLPAPFANGMFIGQHGSWNRQPHSGYKVIFVPFASGRPSGAPVDVLTGFLSKDGNAYGRPVGVAPVSYTHLDVYKRQAEDFPIVCVGGSAGGLDAYTRLLRHLPDDMGVAIVIVNHLRTVALSLIHI